MKTYKELKEQMAANSSTGGGNGGIHDGSSQTCVYATDNQLIKIMNVANFIVL